MPLIYGKEISREAYLRRVGNPRQCFGIHPIAYTSGRESLVRAFDVDNAGGLRFAVCESKGMDLLNLSYRGINFGFETKAGISSPWIADEQGMAYRGSLGAGFMYTAGLSNVGGPCEDGAFYHYAHGALKDTPAENVCCETLWNGDECTLALRGSMRDSAFFGRNLTLNRSIQTEVGSKSLRIEDSIENEGFSNEQLMLLYHMNIGFPVLDEDTELIVPLLKDEPLSEHTEINDPDYARMIAPIDNNEEYLHALTLGKNPDGMTLAAVWNPRLQIGLCIRYHAEVLRYLIQWKCMLSGDYALGILPSTCKPLGRLADRASGEARYLKPGEKLHTCIEISILDHPNEIQAILSSLSEYALE